VAGRPLKKIVVTGAKGLLGWHTASRLHALNCAAKYRNEVEPFELVTLTREAFGDDKLLDAALASSDVLLHFAGLNRGSPEEVESANPAIALRIADSIKRTAARPHIVYANSTHAALDTPYGRSKKRAAQILEAAVPGMTDLILPHIFGECARPYYNNVTATLIDQLWKGEEPTINPEGEVELLHAGNAANIAIAKGIGREGGQFRLEGRRMTIVKLFGQLAEFHRCYQSNIFPNLDDDFDLALFNSYRTGGYPHYYPIRIKTNGDSRGLLFESAKSMGSSQTFLSTTLPGKTRGDHFHTDLVERFLVVSGEATIRIRKVLTNDVQTFHVSGSEPVAIDMPPLHTHHIANDGSGEVVTFFWSHRHFDPKNPDTYADPVLTELSYQ
jgi:UDP-2-acetamido-2,6-beta-L-arabino-hexul-4-ose reductase